MKTGISFFGISFVPSNRMKGMKNAPMPMIIVYSRIVMTYCISAKIVQQIKAMQLKIVIIMLGI